MRCERCAEDGRFTRREILALMGIGVAVAASGCSVLGSGSPTGSPGRSPAAPPTTGRASVSQTTVATGVAPVDGAPPVPLSTQPVGVEADAVFPPPRPGRPEIFYKALQPTQQIALTIDDGLCAPCSSLYVEFASETGVHITFSPNGKYQDIWNPLAAQLRPLIDAGQVQIGNHTFSHLDLRRLSDPQIREEIEKNEAWIEDTFGVTARPWFRPPFGYRDERTDWAAAETGYTNILLWNGTFGDSALLTQEELMAQALEWLKPGTVMLGHANHMTVTTLFDWIQELIAERNLTPVTLDEMFGTSRQTG